ncbi:hypothetical protein LCGC14_2005420 [marine sediment metagenome]|uniref:Uncharacterized protein n=1 Tax=marine sediment metagenome TaxID=412755 RepID=A0A0F9F210_9ZZZZ
MKTITCTLYSYWASALINGDTSGLEKGEEREIELLYSEYLEGYEGIDCVSVEEESHFGIPEYPCNALAGDIAEYIFILR